MADINLNGAAAPLVEQIAKLERRVAVPQTSEKVHYIVVPKDSDVKSLLEFQYPQGLPPTRVKAEVFLRDWESFCLYVKGFRESGTIIFGEPQAKRFHAIIDYHQAGSEGMETAPDFGGHNVHFSMIHSSEWNTWFGANQKVFTQIDFAEFLEDNFRDILIPSAAEMMQVARTLKATSDVTFNSKVNLVDGSANFTYIEDVKAQTNGEFDVPEEFTIKIPVFYGEEKQEVKARLRWRFPQGKLTFYYKLYRTSEILEEAFVKTATAIGNECDLKVLLGDEKR